MRSVTEPVLLGFFRLALNTLAAFVFIILLFSKEEKEITRCRTKSRDAAPLAFFSFSLLFLSLSFLSPVFIIIPTWHSPLIVYGRESFPRLHFSVAFQTEKILFRLLLSVCIGHLLFPLRQILHQLALFVLFSFWH